MRKKGVQIRIIRALAGPAFCCLAFSCAQKIDPQTADLEVRKLLKDVPSF